MATSNKSQWKPTAIAAAIILALIADLFAAPRALAADPAPSGTGAIAIANIEKIFESVHEYQDIVQVLGQERKAVQSSLQEQNNQLTSMKQALSYLKPDSPQYSDQQQKVLDASIKLDVAQQEAKLDLDRKEKTKMRGLFMEIQDAVAQIAQQDGISLVISDQRPQIPDVMEGITSDQLRALISQRTVLFSDTSRDISGKVITLLDKNYAAKVSEPPAAK